MAPSISTRRSNRSLPPHHPLPIQNRRAKILLPLDASKENATLMGKIIGIDLGTTNCCVAVLEGGTVQIVPNKEGGRTTPSVVGFTDKGERLVGQIAKRQAVTNASNTFYAVKRLIGRKFNEAESERTRETAPFEIVEASNGDARIQVQGRV